MKHAIVALAAGLLLPSAAHAQSASAENPAGLVKLLKGAGYEPKLSTDGFGDPMIEFELSGYSTTLLFYGCDETTHEKCNSVQLRTGFDRDEAWTGDKALQIAKKFRFASVWLDDDGDPWVQWDIMTGRGIPADVFLTSVEYFGDTVSDTATMVFDEE